MLTRDTLRGAINTGGMGACSFVGLRSVVTNLSFSLAKTGGVLVVGRHCLPVTWCAVLLPFVCDIGSEEVRGDVDHGDGGCEVGE